MQYWRQRGEWSLVESLQVGSKRIEEVQWSLEDLIVQAELVATPPIFDLTRKPHAGTKRCWQTH